MRRLFVWASAAGLCLASPAAAYEYGLQFTPSYGARGLTVAGYAFKDGGVTGNCSYYTVTGGGSGRGGGYHTYTTHYNQTCGWDMFGNLRNIAQGAPTPPTPISSVNGLTVYARDARGDTTGTDTSRYPSGFVNTLSPQYTWVTPSGGYLFLSGQQKTNIYLTLQSIGDFSLTVSKITPTVNLAKATVTATTCMPGIVPRGHICRIVVTYDPTAIPGGDDPYTAYDHLTVSITSDSGQSPVFSESVEVPIAPAG